MGRGDTACAALGLEVDTLTRAGSSFSNVKMPHHHRYDEDVEYVISFLIFDLGNKQNNLD